MDSTYILTGFLVVVALMIFYMAYLRFCIKDLQDKIEELRKKIEGGNS